MKITCFELLASTLALGLFGQCSALEIELPATTTSLLHGICGKGASSLSASSSQSSLTYTSVDPFEDGVQAWDDRRSYFIEGVDSTPCANGVFLRPTKHVVGSGVVITIDVVPDEDPTTVCVFVEGNRSGGFPISLVEEGFNLESSQGFGWDYYSQHQPFLLFCKNVGSPSINGDPHIQTWSGLKYDFHGVCDLVLLQNPDFHHLLGMQIHVRTKQLKQFSYVSSAVLEIGHETLEVMGDSHENLYWINKQPKGSLSTGISGYPILYRKVNAKQHEFIVDLGGDKAILVKTFKKFVRVDLPGATKESFGTSLGLLGSYGSGKMIARDNTTEMEDVNAFGQEWQVVPSSDGMLFHNVEGPQAPEKCELPVASSLRRRLELSNISEHEAEIACASVNPNFFDECVFDVMATNEIDVAGAY